MFKLLLPLAKTKILLSTINEIKDVACACKFIMSLKSFDQS